CQTTHWRVYGVRRNRAIRSCGRQIGRLHAANSRVFRKLLVEELREVSFVMFRGKVFQAP
ncbi:hypothetical protein ACFVAV_18680, partial [Nocardia sp. NPDC057663]|uniref:hypothetical protein n=1 Tax=Nocardia sp. NPDC057663 TaxID=3346201 RepID=UPI00366BF465